MGQSRTPKYRIEMTVTGFYYTPAGWNCKDSGAATDENLARYIEAFEQSTQPGGVNAHLGTQKVSKASIVRQSDGETVATYSLIEVPAPVFQVIAAVQR